MKASKSSINTTSKNKQKKNVKFAFKRQSKRPNYKKPAQKLEVKKKLIKNKKWTDKPKKLNEFPKEETVDKDHSKKRPIKDERTAEEKLIAKEKAEHKRKKIVERKAKTLPSDHPDVIARTIYVGNVSVNATRKSVEAFFEKYGKVECARLRGVPVESPGVSKKEAVTMKKFHQSRKTLISFVRFKDKESAEAALQANGEMFKNNHLTVTKSNEKTDKNSHSVFVGNLPINVEDEALWKHFAKCGTVCGVRVVRSASTGSGKGFGFVSFKEKESIEAALALQNTKLQGRSLRVKKIAKKPKIRLDKKVETGAMAFMKQDKPKINIDKAQKMIEKKQKKVQLKHFDSMQTKKEKLKRPKKKMNKKLQKEKRIAHLLCGDEAAV